MDEESLPPIGSIEMLAIEPVEPDSSSTLEIVDLRDEHFDSKELSPEDRRLAELQKVCPVTELPLDSMGGPIKVMIEDRPVFICCESCRNSLLTEPAKYLTKFKEEAVK